MNGIEYENAVPMYKVWWLHGFHGEEKELREALFTNKSDAEYFASKNFYKTHINKWSWMVKIEK